MTPSSAEPSHASPRLRRRLSASLLRQASYTTTRFGCYMYLRELLADSKGNLPFYQKAREPPSSSFIPFHTGLIGSPHTHTRAHTRTHTFVAACGNRCWRRCSPVLAEHSWALLPTSRWYVAPSDVSWAACVL